MDLKADLLRPEAYGAPSADRVELVETHISWVFLVGGRVFKVKRPVTLGFLDFSSIERREQACRAEVALNGRLAPGVYVGVVAVRRGPDGRCRIGGEGPVVDWAVQMNRLADDRRADVLLERGSLTTASIDAIAERLARFHAEARADDAVARFGSPEAIAFNVEENFAQTAAFIEAYVPAQAADIVRWQTAFLRGHARAFEARVAARRIRDGHGDLRLEHVYLDERNQPTIVDCIEFNERFRHADVCADLAFLSMDLAAHGRVDLAEWLVARYARAADDYDLYELVDFYESYRALVRAKVAAILAADDDVAPATRARAAASARRHFLLAAAADRRSMLLPAVVAVGGVIASGKSTIADRIAREMSAAVVEADRTRKSMLGVAPTTPLAHAAWQGAYDPQVTRSVYAEVLRRAGLVLSSGRPVVVDASFRSRAARQAVRELAVAHGVPFRFVECRADPAVCRARLARRERGESVSDGRLAVFDAFLASFEPVVELVRDEHVVLDTSRPVDEAMARVRACVDTWPKGFVA